MAASRLPPQPGEWIDRGRTLAFEFEGGRYQAYAGDVIASALLAGGCRILGRSFKYHRPRGVLSLANHDANVLVETATRINIRADVEPVVDGERYAAVNTFGGVERDRGRFLELLAPLLPVGFYYKAFHRPRALFPYWERLIRRASGLGRIGPGHPAERTPLRRRYCDVLIVGAGPAGLACARALTGSGLAVVLADENARPGGSLSYAPVHDQTAQTFLREALAALAAAPNVQVINGGAAAGFYTDREVPIVTAGGIRLVTARAVVVATGVIEQPAVFRNNDLPGVMLASGAARLVHRYGVAPFAQGVMLAGNVDAYHTALDLKDCGLDLVALVDLEDPAARGPAAEALAARGVKLIACAYVSEALAAQGVLCGVKVTPMGAAPGTADQHIACDGLLMSVGYAPATQLLHQAHACFSFCEAVGQMVPSELPPGVFAAGRVNGQYELAVRIADGAAAAAAVLQYLGRSATVPQRPAPAGPARSFPNPLFAHPRRKNFVDFDEDIQLDDLSIACREGFDNVELLKRYTTNGMGPSQGKHSNLNAARFLAGYHQRPLAEVGSTTSRPFYHPVPMGMLAGRRLRLHWDSALNPWHAEAGAVWMDAGSWQRPKYYRRGSPEQSRLAEYRAVRERVGLIDVSTLGKIEVFGPDAARLLNLCYTSAVDKTAVGMTRYVFMLDPRGTIVDDGVAARLGAGHFYVTAGTGHALATYRQLTQVAALYELDCDVIDVTRHTAAVNVAGPAVRALLQPLTDLDLSAASFPFLGVRETSVLGFPVRMMRVGFVGEVGYEIHLAYSQALPLWSRLMADGARVEILPFGVETQRQLRLEKGHLIVSQDTDGVMNPYETGLAQLVNLKKGQFIGKAALELLREQVERAIVGFETAYDDAGAPIEESHLIVDQHEIVGRVTSIGYSPALGKTVGIAVIAKARAEVGGRFTIRLTNGGLVPARIVPMPFYDPGNSRQKDPGPVAP